MTEQRSGRSIFEVTGIGCTAGIPDAFSSIDEAIDRLMPIITSEIEGTVHKSRERIKDYLPYISIHKDELERIPSDLLHLPFYSVIKNMEVRSFDGGIRSYVSSVEEEAEALAKLFRVMKGDVEETMKVLGENIYKLRPVLDILTGDVFSEMTSATSSSDIVEQHTKLYKVHVRSLKLFGEDFFPTSRMEEDRLRTSYDAGCWQDAAQKLYQQLSDFYLSYWEGDKEDVARTLASFKDDPVALMTLEHVLDKTGTRSVEKKVYGLRGHTRKDASPSPISNILGLLMEMHEKGIDEVDRMKVDLFLQYSGDSASAVRRTINGMMDYMSRCDNIDEVLECISIDVDGCEIIRKLGSGADGDTYLAHADLLDKDVVVKITGMRSKKRSAPRPWDDLSEDSYEDDEESEILASLEEGDLDNIVRIYNALHRGVLDLPSERIGAQGRKKTKYAIIMEYVEGQDMRDMILSGSIDVGTAVKYSSQIFRGLLRLRKAKRPIFHRDIRPENMIVRSEDGEVKIIDFSNATRNPDARPTKNRRYGGETDYFSLGLITYEMITGEHLVLGRLSGRNTKSYADEVKEKKEKIIEKGRLSYEYKLKILEGLEKAVEPVTYPRKVEDNHVAFMKKEDLVKKLLDLIVTSLESNDEQQISWKYQAIDKDLQYYFMDRGELLLTASILGDELESAMTTLAAAGRRHMADWKKDAKLKLEEITRKLEERDKDGKI